VALLEAMAAGVPVAVTDVGANREVVDNGRCGVILPEDETQWLEAITALITDPKTTTQRIQAAQQRVRTHYSLDATLDGYERLYGGASGD
jgi:glycosyltransferase involved in cell wall biosynthesis